MGGSADQYDMNYLEDRQTSPLWIDQFAVFSDKCLTHNEIANLYKKVFLYETYTKRWYPQFYVQFNDPEFSPNTSNHSGLITVNNGGTLTYIGTTAQVEAETEGPLRLMGERSATFKSKGMARISAHYSTPVINASGNYTLEFFAKFSTSERGVIFSAQTDTYPYKGILIQANARDNEHVPGSIQVSIEEELFLNTEATDAQNNPIRYDDDQFHHYCVIRRGTLYEFWLDGNLVASGYGNSGNMISSFGTIYIMGMMPGDLSVNGSMSQLAYYPFALEEANIKAKSFFYTKLTIKGRITLQGVPHQALLRCMDHKTGQLLVEGLSDPYTGHYEINVFTDNFIDVFVTDMRDQNVRPRAFGPLLAGEFTDIDDIIV